MIRHFAILLLCLTASIGCNRSNNAENAQLKAEAETAKAKAEEEAARARAEVQAFKVELAKAKQRADAAEGELIKLKAALPKPVDDDRRAAEWVLRVGGVVRVNTEGVASEHPKEGELPVGLLKVTFVNLVEPGAKMKLTSEGVKYLEGLKHLKVLEIHPVGIDDFSFLKGMDSLDTFHCELTDDGLSHLKTLPGIKNLAIGGFFGNAKITDVGLAHLKDLKNLERLDLSGVALTDSGLEHLAKLNKLQWLNLFRTRVSDVGLQHLKGLTELRQLHLVQTQVKSPGIEHLRALPKLEFLNISENKITDEAITHLKGLSNLRSLHLTQTQVTDDGIKALKVALPNCSITGDVKK